MLIPTSGKNDKRCIVASLSAAKMYVQASAAIMDSMGHSRFPMQPALISQVISNSPYFASASSTSSLYVRRRLHIYRMEQCRLTGRDRVYPFRINHEACANDGERVKNKDSGRGQARTHHPYQIGRILLCSWGSMKLTWWT